MAIEATAAGQRTAAAVPIRTATTGTRTATDAIFISKDSIFLPRYSGVRPTIRPATNTVTMAKMIMPYRPDPTPPKMTSPNCINHIGTRPPSGVKESCIALTDPLEAAQVAVAQLAEPVMPKRTSLPSMLPPLCAGLAARSAPEAASIGVPCCSK